MNPELVRLAMELGIADIARFTTDAQLANAILGCVSKRFDEVEAEGIEGEIHSLSVLTNNDMDKVIVKFPVSVKWVGIRKQAAYVLGQMLMKVASTLP